MAISSRDRWVTVRDSETKKQDIRSTGTIPSEAIRIEGRKRREIGRGMETAGVGKGGGGWLVLGRVELSQRWSVRLREREMER